jgi:hypothetical protein
VSDIFNEVDEEVRREQLKKLWDRYGLYFVALAVLLVLGIAGWRAYDWYQSKKAAESGAAFEAAVVLADEGKQQEAQAAFDKLRTEGTPGYRTLARFREAAALGERDRDAALKLYDQLAADTGLNPALRELAGVRAGLLLVDTAPPADLQHRLEPLTGRDRPFRHTAREILALSAWRAGDLTGAQRWFDMITTDAETPAATRSRVEVLMALVNAQGKGSGG